MHCTVMFLCMNQPQSFFFPKTFVVCCAAGESFCPPLTAVHPASLPIVFLLESEMLKTVFSLYEPRLPAPLHVRRRYLHPAKHLILHTHVFQYCDVYYVKYIVLQSRDSKTCKHEGKMGASCSGLRPETPSFSDAEDDRPETRAPLYRPNEVQEGIGHKL